MRTCTILSLCFLGLVSLASLTAGAVTQYVLTDLGTFGGDCSWAYDINDHGQVVGAAVCLEGGERAFLWENGVMTNLGSLTDHESFAEAINNLGQVVGRSYINYEYYHGFLWENGVMTDLGTFGGDSSIGNDINDAGRVVGWAFDASDHLHACYWVNGVIHNLGVGNSTWASAINESNQIAGTRSDHACLWCPDGTWSDLGTLGGSSSEAADINAQGQIVGDSDPGSGYFHPFLWENGAMHDLGLMGGLYGWATGINDAGQIVGAISTSKYGTYKAFLRDEGHMYWIEELVVNNPGWWEFTTAKAINEHGQIVGTYLGDYGMPHAYLLTPIPEPSVLALAALGAVGLLARRRAR
jgi:probable HAF family extracellular repeat protein